MSELFNFGIEKVSKKHDPHSDENKHRLNRELYWIHKLHTLNQEKDYTVAIQTWVDNHSVSAMA